MFLGPRPTNFPDTLCSGCLENWNFENCPGLKFFFSPAVSGTSPHIPPPTTTHHQYYYPYTHVVKCPPRQTFDADSNAIKKSDSSSGIYAKKTTQQKKARTSSRPAFRSIWLGLGFYRLVSVGLARPGFLLKNKPIFSIAWNSRSQWRKG